MLESYGGMVGKFDDKFCKIGRVYVYVFWYVGVPNRAQLIVYCVMCVCMRQCRLWLLVFELSLVPDWCVLRPGHI